MTISPNAMTVWRNYETDGVPSSGNHNISKSDVRTWGTAVETAIDAYSSGAGSIAKSTRALLYADLAHVADVTAWVYADSTAAYNGIYVKVGGTGTGSWTRILDLPYDVIIATDAGAGTANAIVATSSLPVSESALILLNVFEANTGATTVAFNGGSALTIKTAAGNDVASGGLVAGMALLGKITGSTFRMVSDQASAAIQAAAEAAQAAAEAARDVAVASASGIARYTTRAAAAAVDLSGVDEVTIDKWDGSSLYAPAVYSKVAVEPSHSAKFQSADGAWWGMNTSEAEPEMFSAIPDTGTPQNVPLQAWLDFGIATGVHLVARRPGVFTISDGPSGYSTPPSGLRIDLTRNLSVTCSREVIFKGDATITGPIIRVRDPSDRDRYGLIWLGGTFDNSLGVWVDNNSSNECFAAIRLKYLTVKGAAFRGNNNFVTGVKTSDSAITVADTTDVNISENQFYKVQSGVYTTGTGGTNSGGRHIVTNNWFIDCERGMQAKADVERTIFSNNVTVDIDVCAFSSLEVSDDPPARYFIVTGNFGLRCNQFIHLRGPGEGSVVANNVCHDFGYGRDGVVDSAPHAIRLLGISGVIVTGNHVRMKDWTNTANHFGVWISAFTLSVSVPDPGPYTAERNFVHGNIFVGMQTGVVEGTGTPRGINYIGPNIYSGPGTAHATNGSSSVASLLTSTGWCFGSEKLTTSSAAQAGVGIQNDGLLTVARNGTVSIFNALAGDGSVLAAFQLGGTTQGSITGTGTTISYNAFLGSHWSQFDDGEKRDVLFGTVLETTGKMCEWPGEGKEDRLTCVKISDQAGSKLVYGVFLDWDDALVDDPETGERTPPPTNDMYVAALGAGFVRIGADSAVKIGDLVESAGDGTARPQSDDLLRSSTVGKVTSMERALTHADGSYVLPCVLMCG